MTGAGGGTGVGGTGACTTSAPSHFALAVAGVQNASRQQSSFVPFIHTYSPVPFTQLSLTACREAGTDCGGGRSLVWRDSDRCLVLNAHMKRFLLAAGASVAGGIRFVRPSHLPDEMVAVGPSGVTVRRAKIRPQNRATSL